MSKELNKALELLREIRPSIPKDVLELWCKDRDAFLAQRSEFHQHLKECADEVATWPTYKREALGPFLGHELGIEGETETANELNKAPVEQAGGDERAAQWHECTCPKIGEKWNPAKHGKDCPVHQARAALAQPSPTLPPFAEKVLAKLRRFYDCAEDFESGGVDIGRHWLDLLTQLGLLNRVQRSPALWEISQQGEDLLGTPHPSPAQAEKAEAERQEVVDFNPYRYHAEKIRQRADGAASAYEAGRSALGYMEDIAESALIVRNGLDELSAQHERITAKLHDALDESDGDRWKMRSERDAANARLHEVATACATAEQERDAALAEVERLRQFERICEGLPQDAIDGGWTVQGIRGYAKRLEDQLKSALARVAELEKQEPVGWANFRDGRFGAYLHRTEDDARRFDSTALAGKPAGSKQLALYAAPVAQAQHSVPDGFREKFKQCMELAFAEIAYYVSPEKARDPNSRARKAGALATELHAMLASAPGKEGV
ncbi:hypothetical protein [Pseudomonas aeruginosa]|uniref:hypothetical protein n=1 Tax=Pseudomonas aeruginosa TaxID=287 RepID=UPI0024BDB536|nr:hypothetical protein [Pseudomonas aeruginosa]MDJ1357039.1 hypothetical protein [Pseudomonas aeruginosa]